MSKPPETNFSTLRDETLADAATAARGWPWYVKLGVPAVLGVVVLGSAWSVVSGMWEAATTTRVLDAAQMEVVNSAARAVAQGYSEIDANGKQITGNLVTCSNSDSDPKGSAGFGKVTCTVRIPSAKLVNEKTVITMSDRSMDCGIPERGKGTSGCKLR
jgi:hypothetical protein